MSQFQELVFTIDEFARIAKIDKQVLPHLEARGLLTTTRRKVGHFDRKFVTLLDAQDFFKNARSYVSRMMELDETTPLSVAGSAAVAAATAAGDPLAVEVIGKAEQIEELVAAATMRYASAPRCKTQMFYNVKGGTGKSTLTAQYVMRAAMLGYRVLAIDLDGQGHLTVNCDILDAHERPTVYDILINDLPIEQAIMSVAPGLDLIPANLGLCNIEIPLNNKPRREYRLSEAIDRVRDQYDLIVADTNPAASILNCSMLVAADKVNVVCATNPLSFHGMSLVMATIEQMEREFRHKLELRIIPNMYDNREVISQEVLGELKGQFSEFCTEAVVNRSADLNEATKRRTTVFEVNTKGHAAIDIGKLADELLF